MSDQDNNLRICGCCAEDDPALVLYNPPGLPALKYRIGTHGSFKKEMLDAISNNKALSKLTSRYDDDLAIATLDAWATVLDILSFYQERICNEGYLRTAIERLSVVCLAQHIHYIPAPGLSAETYLAFAMSEAQGAPPSAIIPKGTKVQSIPKQNQLPQIFETEEEITAKVNWNNIKPKATKTKYPRVNHQEIYLQGTQTGLQTGDKILIVAATRAYNSAENNWDFRTVNNITVNSNLNYTLIELDQEIGSRHDLTHIPHPVISPKDQREPDYPMYKVGVRSTQMYWRNPGETLMNSRFIELENFVDQPAPAPAAVTPSSTTVEVESALQSANNSMFKVFVMRQKANLFGYNAPDIKVLAATSGKDLSSLADVDASSDEPIEWKGFTISDIAKKPDGNAVPNTIYLDALYPKIVKDSWLIMTNEENTQLFGVSDSSESTRSGFALSTKAQGIEVHDDPIEKYLDNFDQRVRQTMVYAQSEELQIAALPIIEPLSQKQIILEDVIEDLSKGQQIFISGKRWRLEIPAGIDDTKITIASLDKNSLQLVSGTSFLIMNQPETQSDGSISLIKYVVADNTGMQWSIIDQHDPNDDSGWQPQNLRVVSAETDDDVISEFHIIDAIEFLSDGDSTQNHTRLTLHESIINYFDLQTLAINANVAGANHGETKQEVLGSGNASQTFQKFQLKQQPLTFTSTDNPSGAQTTLEIRVNNIKWKEVPSFYGASPKDKIYTVTIADDGTVTVCFGDGITGSRLPTGTGNIKAIYRSGIGSSGLMDANQLSMLVTPQLGVNKVTNPLPSSGAQDAETIDSARKNAPFTVLTLDRIVSAIDFENFTRSFAGIGKARADISWNGEQEIVNITVALADGTPIQPTDKVYDRLLSALKDFVHANATVNVNPYQLSSFTIDASLEVDEDYAFEDVKLNVVTSLFQAFSFDTMNFGQDITAAQVINVIQNVEGVVYVKLNNMANHDTSTWTAVQPTELLLIDINNSNISQLK